jgi:hypothetical protein
MAMNLHQLIRIYVKLKRVCSAIAVNAYTEEPRHGVSERDFNVITNDEALKQYTRYRNDPWAFLTECCFTKDAVDLDNPIKQYPNYDYLRFIVRLWQREKLIAVPKSRRLTQSWTFLALKLWDCIFFKGREHAAVSKKEDDSMELVSRIEFMFNHIPQDKIPRALLPTLKGGRMLKSPPKIEFEFGDGITSYCAGFPTGADQLRQFTFSDILVDEAAFQPEFENMYSAARPTILGGGRMTLISSRAPGFFKNIVFDKISLTHDNFAEVAPVPVLHPMQGIEMWKNPENEFVVVDLHYSAHPDRRTPEYKAMLKRTLPLYQYLREYEKSWSAFSGMPVYPNFRKDIHISSKKLEPHQGLPLLFGWDFGLTPSCILAQKQGNSLKVLKEWVSQNEGIQTFAPKVMSDVGQLYPAWSNPQKDHFHWIDPAGFQKAQTDARSCAQVMQEYAPIYNLEPGPINLTDRKGAVEHFLLGIDKDGAWLELDPEEVSTLLAGFDGGYRYKDSQSSIETTKPEPIKDKHSHPHDAFQYLAWGAKEKLPSSIVDMEIPAPDYGFTHTSKRPERKLKYGTY